YQALRRCYRFGQTRPVEAHIFVAETETAVAQTVKRKLADHEALMAGMLRGRQTLNIGEDRTLSVVDGREVSEGRFTLRLGDSVETIRAIPDGTVDLTITSPPFSHLYIYSDALQDMGNSADDAEFFEHFAFLIPELHRVTRPGRLCAVHCKQLVNYKGRDGMAGLRDFRGALIAAFVAHGWAYHSEVVIWTDPVFEMQRTKSHGLLYKQLRKDSTFSRQGLPEYLLLFRRWPDGPEEEGQVEPVSHTHAEFPLEVWQRYASPVWFDVRRTDVLNVALAREERDSKHNCPLQLGIIERALDLWSNPGDLIYDPFAGVGSTGYLALRKGRRFEGGELKPSYFEQALRFLREAQDQHQLDMFALLGAAS
ncbi:MAG: DNA-methyltransferase, partial [Chloroflexota bacterium]